jgi:hypothetical protein
LCKWLLRSKNIPNKLNHILDPVKFSFA